MKIKIFLIAIISSLTLVGCNAQEEFNKNQLDNNKNQEQKKEDSEKENPTKEEGEISKQETNEGDNPKLEQTQDEFNLYTVDVNDYSVIPFENKTFTIQSDKDIESNLKDLCNKLQKEYFKDTAKIQVVSINSDKIATINLVNEEAWMKHFQGSTGGLITQGTIVETLLQKQYQGDWIKGLKIQVDGKDGQEYDHVTFSETFMRDTK